jgi:Ser/Thr protein kinase RdoA (MazF antagonist)
LAVVRLPWRQRGRENTTEPAGRLLIHDQASNYFADGGQRLITGTERRLPLTSDKGFSELTPDVILSAVEAAMGVRLTGLVNPFPSYINRVYELRAADGTKYVAKFYRPGRWSAEAIADEHAFLADCAELEIPVVPPIAFPTGRTTAESSGIVFSVFPKRAGRQFEINTDDDWIRVGSLIARVHMAGGKRAAPSRIVLGPLESCARDVKHLLDGGYVTKQHTEAFQRVTGEIIDIAAPLFEGVRKIRVHGDFHRGNVLDRMGEGLLVIDFDDMAMGPPIQDLWLMLPDHAKKSRLELDFLAEGYDQFGSFDWKQVKLIEPLRAMRIIYFLAWCSRQIDDFQFRRNFPDWGSTRFWDKEIADIEDQLKTIREHLEAI